MTFTDTKFLSAAEKKNVLKQWTAFIKGGFKWDQFHKALYNHLIQHCSFIAHYNRLGFWEYYFASGQEPLRHFLKMFGQPPYLSAEMGMDYWYTDREYGDLSRAMVEVFKPLYPSFLAILNHTGPVMVATYPLTDDLKAKLEQAGSLPGQIPLL
jgi:hypothetical protein